MMLAVRRGLAATALITGLALAAPLMAQEAAAPAVVATSASGGQVMAPSEGKGQVVFFRQSKFAGAAVSYSIRENGKGSAKLGNGSYFVLTLDPGSHTFTNESEASDSLTLEIEPGETYYVKQSLGMGVLLYRPHLTPSTKEEFEQSKVKLSTKTATDSKSAS